MTQTGREPEGATGQRSTVAAAVGKVHMRSQGFVGAGFSWIEGYSTPWRKDRFEKLRISKRVETAINEQY